MFWCYFLGLLFIFVCLMCAFQEKAQHTDTKSTWCSVGSLWPFGKLGLLLFSQFPFRSISQLSSIHLYKNTCFWIIRKIKFHCIHFIKQKRFLSNIFKTMKRHFAEFHLNRKCYLFQCFNLKACSSILFHANWIWISLGVLIIYFWKPTCIVSSYCKKEKSATDAGAHLL